MKLTALLFGITIIAGMLAQIAGIGYGLYLWGGVGLEFSVSAWSGFKVWMSFMGTAIISLISYFYFRLKEKRAQYTEFRKTMDENFSPFGTKGRK